MYVVSVPFNIETTKDFQQFKKELCLKGQLISKRFFGVVDFLQKTNENMLHTSKNEFICSYLEVLLA